MGFNNTKILVITNDDNIWLLPAWYKVLKTKDDRVVFKKILTVPDRLSNLSEVQKYSYYLKIFGIINFILLGIFFLLNAVKNVNIKKNISKYALLEKLNSFDTERISLEIINNKPDIVFITCGYIIPNKLLDINKDIIWINKHASLLPQTKGLFPYIWNVINNKKQGISFHKVIKNIDQGEIVHQEQIIEKSSMVSFYKEIYYSFDKYFFKFLSSLNNQSSLKNTSGDYYSLPTKKDMEIFNNNGGEIIKMKDLL